MITSIWLFNKIKFKINTIKLSIYFLGIQTFNINGNFDYSIFSVPPFVIDNRNSCLIVAFEHLIVPIE